jgi:hypothetical protein
VIQLRQGYDSETSHFTLRELHSLHATFALWDEDCCAGARLCCVSDPDRAPRGALEDGTPSYPEVGAVEAGDFGAIGSESSVVFEQSYYFVQIVR